jgi:glycerol-3-phosphate cytidylyltransferase
MFSGVARRAGAADVGLHMKTILTYGTFDLLHVGHVRLLMNARSMGDFLIVGLSTDKFNEIKGKTAVYNFFERYEILLSCKHVSMIIPETNWEQKSRDILSFHVDTLVMGSDWRGKFDYLRSLCQVIYLPRTQGISTTLIKSAVIQSGREQRKHAQNLGGTYRTAE